MTTGTAPGRDPEPTAAGSGFVRALWPEGRAFLWRRRAVLAVLAFWSLLEAGQTFLLGYAPARALDDGFLKGDERTGLAWLAVAGLAVLVGAYGTGRVYRAVAALAEPLRDGLVRRVVDRGLREAVAGGRRDGTAVVSRLTHQVEIARDTFAGVVMVLRSFAFTAGGALAGLAALAPALLLVVGPPLLLGIALFLVTLRPMARRQQTFLEADEALARELGTVASGLRDVAACGAEERVGAAAGARIDAEYRASSTLARWSVLRVAALGIGGRLPLVLLLASAPWLLDHGVTPGALVGALAYVTQSLLPALSALISGLGTSGARLAVVLHHLARGGPPAPSPAAPRPAAPVPGRPAVELRGVTFSYGPGARAVVRDLHLVVDRSEHLAVVGPSGIGKSTLAGLVAGLLEPGAGEVRVLGVSPRGRRPEELAGLRVLIPQQAYVFGGTVRENLAYHRPEGVPDGELHDAAAALGLDALVARLGGLSAPVDPSALSAGERQLVALARAYLSPAPLVLLDEATCHLDPAAEARAERAFARRPGALIVIAHRVTSARRADRVLVMDGAEALAGTHEELLAASPLYRDLVGHWAPAAPRPGRPAPAAPQETSA